MLIRLYKNEAETQIPAVKDYFLKEESFNKLKAAMESKFVDERTKQDVDNCNKSVNDMNAAVNMFNQVNNDMNSSRNEINNNWSNTEKPIFKYPYPTL